MAFIPDHWLRREQEKDKVDLLSKSIGSSYCFDGKDRYMFDGEHSRYMIDSSYLEPQLTFYQAIHTQGRAEQYFPAMNMIICSRYTFHSLQNP